LRPPIQKLSEALGQTKVVLDVRSISFQADIGSHIEL
jgi:hypothetical protein